MNLYEGKWEPTAYLAELEHQLAQLDVRELEQRIEIVRARARIEAAIRKVSTFIADGGAHG